MTQALFTVIYFVSAPLGIDFGDIYGVRAREANGAGTFYRYL